MVTTWADESAAQLRRAGYRMGAARTALLSFFEEQRCCVGANEIHEALNARGQRVGLASVYRVIDTLLEHGLLERVDVGDGIARFEPARTRGHHHHLVCDDCGKVEAFADPGLESAIRRVEQASGYAVAGHDVVLRGACESCRDD